MRKLNTIYAWGIVKYNADELINIIRPYLEIYRKTDKSIFIRPKHEFGRITITGDAKKSPGAVILTLECFTDPLSMLKRYLTFMDIPYELNTETGSLFLKKDPVLYGGLFIFNSLQDLQESVREYISFKKEVLSC